MKTPLTSLFVLSLSLALPLSVHAAISVPADFSFTKNLKQGDNVTPDVMYLQNVLNSNPQTQVASSGPGSDASLTPTYGSKTKDAVMRFQSFYSADVLAPANLTAPTGIVGSLTRAKLNALLATLRGQTVTTGSNGASNLPNVYDTSSSDAYDPYSALSAVADPSQRVAILGISTYGAVPGQTMSVFGKGFDANSNTIQIGSELIRNIPSKNGTLISFTIPQTLETGAYSILVFNKFGIGSSGALAVSVNASAPVHTTNTTIFGSTPPATNIQPSLTGLSPKNSKFITQVIVVTGNGFTADNTIMTNLGNVYHVPSGDGKTLTFTVGNLPLYVATLEKYKGQSGNLTVKVSNENGTTKDELTHTLSFPTSGSLADTAPATTADILSSTADFQKYVASTSYSFYMPYSAASSSDSLLQALFGSVGSMNAGIFGTSGASALNATNTSAVSVNPSPVTINGTFGGVVTKITSCADNTALVYINDYAHLFKTYAILYDPQSSRIGSPLGNKDTVRSGAMVSGNFVPGNRNCLSGNSSSAPQVLIDTAIGTIATLEKII